MKANERSVEVELLTEISKKLDRVVALLAAQGKPIDKQVQILVAAGNDSAFIGSVVGLTSARVRQLDAWKRSKRAVNDGDVATADQSQ
jgi:hypothetical protein